MLLHTSRFWGLLAAGWLATAGAWAQQGPGRPASVPEAAPSDEQSYRKEFVYGVNFNTQAGLLGGVSVRSTHVLDDWRLRFWSLEGVMLKNAKEERIQTSVGSFIYSKINYAFVLRPSVGVQRILFRKAADAGVQVNGLVSVGPSLGLLMPYYITYDRTGAKSVPPIANASSDDIVDEQYDPAKHPKDAILDRGPLFSGIGQTQLVPGLHLRGGLSFEYGRYRDAVTGLEVGFLVEGFSKRLLILSPNNSADAARLNRQFFPSVYLTLYFGHRS